VWLGHTPVEIKLTGADTCGAFALFVDQPPVDWSLPAHRHLNEAETIYIALGEFEMTIGEEQSVLGPGDVAHVPAGVLHSGRSLSSEPGRRVLVFSPSGIERFFLEACTEEKAELDVERFVQVAESYGWRFGA
jgi:mannose-6-phosphate isomerase-like protein (cupin superfamily)